MAIDPKDFRVAVLAGGSSGEREISLASGEGAKGALLEAGFDVVQLDPANKDDLKRLLSESIDVAFLCTHGRGGEDGAIQGFLELAGIPYTGSGIQASALALDKDKTKVFYRLGGIPTAPSVTLHEGSPYDVAEIIAELGGKCVVKPATEGSSLGIEIVEGESALAQALLRAFTFDKVVVVESFIEGIEITVVALGNDDPVALPVIQIVPQGDFYDVESKYAPGGSKHLCPAPLSEEVTLAAQELSCRAHKALGCAGVSRTDFIVDADGELWALETNTLPGMTSTSLLPDAARAAGIPFPELCTKLIESALE